MSPILISGLINLETSLRVDGFPLPYFPVRYPFFGVKSTVSGVGFNVAKALTTLGDEVRFCSLIGEDDAGEMARGALMQAGIPGRWVLPRLVHTPQSVILYDGDGRRQIHVDLKDIQEQVYPEDVFLEPLQGCDLAALCNINFSRPFLQAARSLGIPVATDVHAISSLDDDYNRDFMAAAEILFMSDENLPVSPEEIVRQVWDRFGTEIVVVGRGSQGALLGVRREGTLVNIPAAHVRPVVSTIGAGDALFSAFLHDYRRSRDPHQALRKAVVFAGHKIGAAGAAEGFLSEPELERLVEQT